MSSSFASLSSRQRISGILRPALCHGVGRRWFDPVPCTLQAESPRPEITHAARTGNEVLDGRVAFAQQERAQAAERGRLGEGRRGEARVRVVNVGLASPGTALRAQCSDCPVVIVIIVSTMSHESWATYHPRPAIDGPGHGYERPRTTRGGRSQLSYGARCVPVCSCFIRPRQIPQRGLSSSVQRRPPSLPGLRNSAQHECGGPSARAGCLQQSSQRNASSGEREASNAAARKRRGETASESSMSD